MITYFAIVQHSLYTILVCCLWQMFLVLRMKNLENVSSDVKAFIFAATAAAVHIAQSAKAVFLAQFNYAVN